MTHDVCYIVLYNYLKQLDFSPKCIYSKSSGSVELKHNLYFNESCMKLNAHVIRNKVGVKTLFTLQRPFRHTPAKTNINSSCSSRAFKTNNLKYLIS